MLTKKRLQPTATVGTESSKTSSPSNLSLPTCQSPSLPPVTKSTNSHESPMILQVAYAKNDSNPIFHTRSKLSRNFHSPHSLRPYIQTQNLYPTYKTCQAPHSRLPALYPNPSRPVKPHIVPSNPVSKPKKPFEPT